MIHLKRIRILVRRSSRNLARGSIRRRSLLAMTVSIAAVAILYSNNVPAPASVDPVAVSMRAKTAASGLLLSSVSYTVTAMRPEIEDFSEPANVGEPSNGESDALRSSRMALLVNLLLLEKGYQKLQQTSDYTATFFKQEAVDGEMMAAQRMEMKLRHKPFSVYLKWIAENQGRELLFVDGQNDGKMIVKLGGFKGRLLPALKLDPNGSMALREARHPVTEIGLLKLTRRIVAERQQQLEQPPRYVQCRLWRDRQFDGRPCYLFVLEFGSPRTSPKYRKTVQYVDREYLLPVCIKNYAWSSDQSATNSVALDEETLIEHYSYSTIHMEKQLAEIDFDRGNEDYRFRR